MVFGEQRVKANDSLILFFIKYPEPGCVKTRLSKVLGAEVAATIYRNFVSDMLEKLEASDIPFFICFWPPSRAKGFEEWLGRDYQYLPQGGNDLGERMKGAFEKAFLKGYKRVVLVGSDIPDLPFTIIAEALKALETWSAAIAPALDGGYYLIGFHHRSFVPSIFQDIQWGKESVFRKTLSLLEGIEGGVYILPAWSDVDTLEELIRLLERSPGTEFSSSRTIRHLASLSIGALGKRSGPK